MLKFTKDQVLERLRTVPDPDLKQDLVTLGMVRDLELGADGSISLRIVLTTPACPMKDKIATDARAALASLPGAGEIRIRMDAEVRGRSAAAARGAGEIPGVQHVIAVSSGKGGVGKSTVAVNLATALALQGARVGLMDADVYGPNVPTMMGVTDSPRIERDPNGAEVFVPPSAHGLKVMSMGFLMPADQPAVWRGPMLHSVVSQFCHKTHWGSLDYLVVDMPPGTGDVQLSLAQLVPVSGAVLVTTPQEVSMQDVRRAFHMFEKVRVPVLGVVENMSYFRCGGCQEAHSLFGKDGGITLARKLGVELLAQLPLVPEVREGGDEGWPVVIRRPDSEPARAFAALAGKIAQRLSILAAGPGGAAEAVHIGRFE
jgi:ATP-binding protein involved in chromosome partitioning